MLIVIVSAGEAPLLDQGSLFVLLERVGVLVDFQLAYAQLAASCSAMAAAVAAFRAPMQVHSTQMPELLCASMSAFLLTAVCKSQSSRPAQ